MFASFTNTQIGRLYQNILERIWRIHRGQMDYPTLAYMRPGLAKAYRLVCEEMKRRAVRQVG